MLHVSRIQLYVIVKPIERHWGNRETESKISKIITPINDNVLIWLHPQTKKQMTMYNHTLFSSLYAHRFLIQLMFTNWLRNYLKLEYISTRQNENIILLIQSVTLIYQTAYKILDGIQTQNIYLPCAPAKCDVTMANMIAISSTRSRNIFTICTRRKSI